VVKIADFGIASANLFREEPGVLKGKFGYMSPEQARGEKVDRRSDIYALGVVLYELVALRSPYGKLDDDSLLAAVREGRFDPPSVHVPDVPPEIEAVVMRAMARSPEARFQTARDMAGAIARVLLARQELVDNASVEQTAAHLLGRDLVQQSHAEVESAAQPQTLAAVPAARTGHESEAGAGAGTGARGCEVRTSGRARSRASPSSRRRRGARRRCDRRSRSGRRSRTSPSSAARSGRGRRGPRRARSWGSWRTHRARQRTRPRSRSTCTRRSRARPRTCRSSSAPRSASCAASPRASATTRGGSSTTRSRSRRISSRSGSAAGRRSARPVRRRLPLVRHSLATRSLI
jgi:serine/threonine protein kinase